MIIDKITVVNFGKLCDFEAYSGDGMNVIYAPNEGGKSTLLAFVKFMFYGSKQKKEPGDLTFKDKYMPWNGMPMSGSIEFTHLGKKYHIYRSEGMKNGGKVYEIKNPLTGETYEGIDNPGQYFFSVGERAFSQSCFVTDSAIITESDDDIISALTGNGNENSSYYKIRESLEEKLLNLESPKRKGSAYNVIKSDEEAVQSKLFQCEKELTSLDTFASEEDELRISLKKAEEELCVLEKRSGVSEKHKKLIKLREIEETLKEESDDFEKLIKSRENLDKPISKSFLTQEEQQILKTPDNAYDLQLSKLFKIQMLLLIFIFVLCFAGLYLCLGSLPDNFLWLSHVCFGASGVIGALVIFVGAQSGKTAKKRRDFLKRKNQIRESSVDTYGMSYEKLEEMKNTISFQIEKSKSRIRELSESAYKLRTELSDTIFDLEDNIFDTNFFTNEDLSGIIKDKQKHIDDIKGSLLRISVQSVRREELSGRAESLRLQLKKLSDQLQIVREKAEVLKTALLILDNAFSNLRDNFAPALSKKSFEIFSAVAGGKYDGIVTNEKFETVLKVSNEYKDMRFLSTGTKELVYLSLRIAESEYLAKGGVPVFLDDILMSFDDERCAKMLEFLSHISENRQIFLCTCRNREKQWCIEETNAVIIEL